MTIQAYITKIPKLFINIKHWLFSDLKQSIALIDQYNLFEDLDIRNLKVNKPPSKEIYSKCFKISNKLCLLPIAMLIVETIICMVWEKIINHPPDKFQFTLAGLMPFVGVLYGIFLWLISFRIAWKYNLIIFSICQNLKHGNQISFIMRSYVRFGIKFFFMVILIISLISIFFYYSTIIIFSFFPAIIITYNITKYIFKMETERAGMPAFFNNISFILNKISNTN